MLMMTLGVMFLAVISSVLVWVAAAWFVRATSDRYINQEIAEWVDRNVGIEE